MEYLSKSPQQTRQIARQFALSLKNGDVVALVGDLGAGKTYFTREILKTLGIKEKIQSPSFVLRKSYSQGKTKFEHFDLYRLDVKELESTGLFEVLGDKKSICFIEWSEKIKDKLPDRTIIVELEHRGADARRIRICRKNET